MHNKFFLISQTFYPDQVSTANLFTDLCRVIAEHDTEVEVWCAQPSYTIRKKQPKIREVFNITIRYLASTNFTKKTYIGRIINYVTFTLSLVVKLLLSNEKSPVFTHTTPPSLGILIAWICTIKKRNFNYILLDIFPEGLIRLGKLSKTNIFVRFWGKATLYALKRSKCIIVIGRDMKEWLIEEYPGAVEKTEYIPLWQNAELINPVKFENNQFLEKFDLKNKFIVQYSGNMGLWQDMQTLAEVVKSTKEEEIHYLFIGDGIRKKEFLKSFDNGLPENLTMLPFQDINDLGNSLTACHIALISLREELAGMAVPSKIYGILASGKPTIALVPEDSEIARIVTEEDCGIVIKPGNTGDVIKAINRLKTDIHYRIRFGKNARSAFENKYTTQILAKKYLELF